MQVERISGVGNKYYPLPIDLALAEFIPEKGVTRDILREQSVEQPVEQEPTVQPQEFNQPTEQGPAYEHVNDSPVQNDECEGDEHQGSDGQDQIANDCHAVGSPTGTAPDIDTTSFTATFTAEDDAFAVDIPDEEPVTALEWLDAAFLPDGELKQVAVQYCLEHGVTDPEEQKHHIWKLVDPDYVRENYVRDKPLYNPPPAAAPEWEDLPF